MSEGKQESTIEHDNADMHSPVAKKTKTEIQTEDVNAEIPPELVKVSKTQQKEKRETVNKDQPARINSKDKETKETKPVSDPENEKKDVSPTEAKHFSSFFCKHE